MGRDVLMIATIKNGDACAREISERAGVAVEVAPNRRAGLAALRRSHFDVVLVEESQAESDPEWADQVWRVAGMAVAVQVNFAIMSSVRLSREVKAALTRKESEKAAARHVLAAELDTEWMPSITGLVLASEMALREPSLPGALRPKLRRIVELAGELRERMERRAPRPDP